MHARDHDVELVEQLGLLVERAVVEDVALDAGQDPKRRELLVQFGNDTQLIVQPLHRESVRHREPRRVVRQRDVTVRAAGQIPCR